MQDHYRRYQWHVILDFDLLERIAVFDGLAVLRVIAALARALPWHSHIRTSMFGET